MNEQEKGRVRLPARIVLYAGVPVASWRSFSGPLHLGRREGPPGPERPEIQPQVPHRDVGLSCDVCHEPNSSNTRFMSFPNHDTCSACHGTTSTPTRRTRTASSATRSRLQDPAAEGPGPFPLVKFDHQQHQKAGVDCAKCHSVFDKDVLTGDEMLPTMDTCVKCHADQKVKGGTDCTFCHVKGLEKIKPTHTAAWKTTHGVGPHQGPDRLKLPGLPHEGAGQQLHHVPPPGAPELREVRGLLHVPRGGVRHDAAD